MTIATQDIDKDIDELVNQRRQIRQQRIDIEGAAKAAAANAAQAAFLILDVQESVGESTPEPVDSSTESGRRRRYRTARQQQLSHEAKLAELDAEAEEVEDLLEDLKAERTATEQADREVDRDRLAVIYPQAHFDPHSDSKVHATIFHGSRNEHGALVSDGQEVRHGVALCGIHGAMQDGEHNPGAISCSRCEAKLDKLRDRSSAAWA
jgi:hypothetical protein